jgi:uncharacterized protein (TIGR03437 family)
MTLADSELRRLSRGTQRRNPSRKRAATERITVVANPRPALLSIFPDNILSGAFPFGLTLNGSNFVRESQVTINGNSRSTFYQSSSVITVSVPASDVAIAGKLAVSVTSPAPGGGTSESATFTVNASPPRIALSPASAASRYRWR